MRRVVAVVLLLVAGLTARSLAIGTAPLDATLPGGLPLGNLLAAVALCALAGTSVALARPDGAFGRVAGIVLVAAAAWLPLSLVLAGNLTLNFSGWRGTGWLLLSIAIVGAVLATLAWALLANLASAIRDLRSRRR